MPDFTVEVDASRVLSGLRRLGDRASALCLSQAFVTANAVKTTAQSLIAKRRPFTYSQIIVDRNRRGDGYVVMMNDKYKDGDAPARNRRNRRRGPVRYKQEKHVGLWLEFGTPRMRPRPFLFPAAQSQERAHLSRIAESLDRAIQEADV